MPLFTSRRLPFCQSQARIGSAWIVTLALAGCEGAQETAPGAITFNGQDVQPVAVSDAPTSRVGPVAVDAAKPRAGPPMVIAPDMSPSPTSAKTSIPPRYELILFDQGAVHRDTDELAPVRGAGYRPLRAFIYASGQPRAMSPVAGVKAYCATPLRCEYLPPRKVGVADVYTVSLPDDSKVRLTAADDMVVISAREFDVEEPLTISVTLTVAGQEAVTRRVIYAKSGSGG